MKLSLFLAAVVIPLGESRVSFRRTMSGGSLGPVGGYSRSNSLTSLNSLGSPSYTRSNSIGSSRFSVQSIAPSKGLSRQSSYMSNAAGNSRAGSSRHSVLSRQPSSMSNAAGSRYGRYMDRGIMGMMGLGTLGTMGTSIAQMVEADRLANERMDHEIDERKETIAFQKNAAKLAHERQVNMTKIEVTATNENIKLCASCSRQLSELFEEFYTLTNDICKDKYDALIDSAASLPADDDAKDILEKSAAGYYNLTENWCAPGGFKFEDLIKRTKATLVNKFGGCDWKCATDTYICHQYAATIPAAEHRELHHKIACN